MKREELLDVNLLVKEVVELYEKHHDKVVNIYQSIAQIVGAVNPTTKEDIDELLTRLAVIGKLYFNYYSNIRSEFNVLYERVYVTVNKLSANDRLTGINLFEERLTVEYKTYLFNKLDRILDRGGSLDDSIKDILRNDLNGIVLCKNPSAMNDKVDLILKYLPSLIMDSGLEEDTKKELSMFFKDAREAAVNYCTEHNY